VQSILTNQAKLNLLSRSGEDIRNIDLSELDNKLIEKNISPELVDAEKQNIITKGNQGLKTTEPHVPVIGELALKSKMISNPQSFNLLLMMQGISRILTNTLSEDFLDINKKLYIDTETNSLVQSIQSTNHLLAIATSLGVNITDKEKNSIARRLFKKVLKNKDLDSKSRENLTRLMKKMKNSNSLRIFNPEQRLINRIKKE
jgi:adenosyl cobinamide kinase/adenosyl cobinamide phosphate guanylyltransferase